MSIKFDLNSVNLSVKDFNLLINKTINTNALVNGYTLNWEYTIEDNIVEVSASIEKK